LSDRRRELDVRIVDAIERVHEERLAEHLDALAMHAMRGGVWSKAYRYSVDAGNRAAAYSAHRDSVAHYLRALEALGNHEAPDGIRAEIDVRLKIRDELFVLGDIDSISAHVQAAADLARKVDDPRRLARALLDLGAVEWAAARHLRSREMYDEALSVAETAGDPILVAMVNYRLGIAHVMLGDMKTANEALAKSVRTLDTEEGRRLFAFGGSPFSFACTFRAWALAELGQLAEAEAVAKSGFDNARALEQFYSIVVSTFGYSHVLIRRGQWEKAAEILDIGGEQLSSYGIGAPSTWLFARRALVAARMGDAGLTDRMIAQSLAARSLHDAFYETFLADAELQLGRYERAADRARQVITTGAEKSEMATVAWGSLILAEALTGLGQGQGAEALTALRRAEELAKRQGLASLAQRVSALQHQ
ncbi:MAG: hypothetical protein AB7U95_22120, partial [Reyranella sp.]